MTSYQYVLLDHTVTEKYLCESGVDYNIIINNLYMENYLLNSIMLANRINNEWFITAGDGKASFIAKDDSARIASALLLVKGDHNKDYDVTGEDLISERGLCDMFC